MKKVIDGLVYNTATAQEIASYSYLYANDFRHVDEALYKTKKGNYFLAGSGGPMSKYAVSVGNSSTGSEGIIPLTEEGAREWCERSDIEADIIEQEFTVTEA